MLSLAAGLAAGGTIVVEAVLNRVNDMLGGCRPDSKMRDSAGQWSMEPTLGGTEPSIEAGCASVAAFDKSTGDTFDGLSASGMSFLIVDWSSSLVDPSCFLVFIAGVT